MGFSFKQAKGAKQTRRKDQNENADDGYRARAKAERERVNVATDGLFWFAVCFREQTELDEFSARFRLSEKLVDGDTFKRATEKLKPDSPKNGFPARTIGGRMPDPLAGIEYTDNLESDCIAEAMALFDAMQKPPIKHPARYSTDSDKWICVYFKSQDEKLQYLKDMGLLKYGSNYLDGTKWLKSL